MVKIFKNSFFTFLLGIVLTGFIGYVVAVEMINASQIGYTKGDGTWMSAADAIDELYKKTDLNTPKPGQVYKLTTSAVGNTAKNIDVKQWLIDSGLSSEIDYTKLTDDNFLFELYNYSSSVTASTSVVDPTGRSPSYSTVSPSIVKSYKNGILTVRIVSASYDYANQLSGSNYHGHAQVTYGASIIPYLILN